MNELYKYVHRLYQQQYKKDEKYIIIAHNLAKLSTNSSWPRNGINTSMQIEDSIDLVTFIDFFFKKYLPVEYTLFIRHLLMALVLKVSEQSTISSTQSL